MVEKPQWKADYDRQVAECQLELTDLLREYPHSVVYEAMAAKLRDRTKTQFKDEYKADEVEDAD